MIKDDWDKKIIRAVLRKTQMGTTKTHEHSVSLNQIGVSARQKTDALSPLLSQPSLVPITSISTNEQGEYSLNSALFIQASQGALYDGDIKVLEWFCDAKGQLVIEVFTDKQLNLFGDLHLKQCLIKAQGPLFLEGCMHVEGTLGITAQALLCAAKIESTGVVALSAQQGVGLMGQVIASDLHVNAAHLHQEASFQVTGQIDCSIQSYKQDSDCLTSAHSLRLIALQCTMEGTLRLTHSCFLTASRLVLGSTTRQSTFKFPGVHHIHVGTLSLVGDAQVTLGDMALEQSGTLTVDSDVFIDELALIELSNTDVTAEFIDNRGEFIIKECVLEVDIVQQSKIFDAEQSQITVFKRFNQAKRSVTQLKNNNFFCRELNEYGGKLSAENCHYKGVSCSIYSGRFNWSTQSKFALSESLFLDEHATSTFKNTHIQVAQRIKILGAAHFEQAEVETDSLESGTHIININGSEVAGRHTLRLMAGAVLKESTILGGHIHLEGDLSLNDMSVRGQYITLTTVQADIEGLSVLSERLTIIGSLESDKVLIKKSILTTEAFSCQNHVTLERSVVYGIDERKAIHDLRAKLKLLSSRFITESQMLQSAKSSLNLQANSSVSTGVLYSRGAMSASHSTVFSEAIIQEGASLCLDSSALHVQKGLFSRGSRVLLKNKAQIAATDIGMGEGDSVRLESGSVLRATESIVSAEGSSLSSDHALVAGKKISAHARTELCASMLCAQELRIYDEFAAQDQSNICVETLIELAKGAHVTVAKSLVASQDVRLAADVSLHESNMAVSKHLSVSPDGALALQGNTSIVADTFDLSGRLTTADSDKDSKTSARLKVHTRLHIDKNAEISGDNDLFLEAEEIVQQGRIHLVGSLRAKGTRFSNYGSVNASSIHLGYDDWVYNRGCFSADNMTVHSNFINLLGRVYAKQSYSSIGFFGLNLGLIAANNYTNSNLLSLNAGLVSPNFSADYKYIFSSANLLNAAKTIATMAVPTYTSAINLAFMIPGLASTATNLYGMYQQLGWAQFKNMRRHEWMPLVSQLKNAATLGWSAFDTLSAASGECATFGADISSLASRALDFNNYSWADVNAAFQGVNWSQMGLRTATLVAGSYTDTSVLGINMGASLAGSTSKTALWNVNLGAEASFISHNINSRWFYNSGVSTGTQATFIARTIYNSGQLQGVSQFTLNADHMVNASSGRVDGTHVNVMINSLEQQGQMSLSTGQVRVGQFSDTAQASTELTSVSVSGDDFRLAGHLDAAHAQFNYSNQVIAEAGSAFHADNVVIKAREFIEGGALSYEHQLTIEADTAILAVGSTVNGKQTDEEHLFVTKETPAALDPPDENSPAADSSEPQTAADSVADSPANAEPGKEFRPQHILTIQAKKIVLDGGLTGGDYTQFRGQPIDVADGEEPAAATQCDSIVVGDSAAIDLTHGSILSKEADIAGRLALSGFDIKIGATDMQQSASVSIDKSSFVGETLSSSAALDVDASELNIAAIALASGASERIKDSTINAKTFIDSSQMAYQGDVRIISDHYEHHGQVAQLVPAQGTEQKNALYVQANTAVLHGSADLDVAHYNIAHFSDGAAFVEGLGAYSAYHIGGSLVFETQDGITIDHSIARDCDVAVKAADIRMTADYKRNHALTLISTVGDVSLLSDISAQSLHVQSAHDIFTNHTIYTTGLAHFEAQGAYYNLGGTLNGDVVAVKAAEIFNVTQGSSAAHRAWGQPMGTTGIINGRSRTYLEASEGNIENYGGIIRAGEYAQLLAKGNVLNACNVRTYNGAFDVMQAFDGGLIAGGTGSEDTNGIGLYIRADGKIISDASDFVSNGINYLEADQGFVFGARQHSYISNQWDTRTWYGTKTHHTETSTTVKGTTIHSGTGQNILRTEHGGVSAVAARFSSPGGTQIYARDDVLLYSLKSQVRTFDSKSSLWGLSSSTRNAVHETSTATLFADNGVTRITSTEGGVDARGAYFVGAGDLFIKAHKRIQFGVDVLAHDVVDKSTGFALSVPGMRAWEAHANHGSWLDVASAEDATVSKLYDVMRGGSTTELLTNSANLGVNLYNTTSSLMRGIVGDSLGAELLSRYGLGGAGGFLPTVTLSMTQSRTKTQYQTLSQGGVDRGGNVSLEAGEGIDLENGVKVHAGGNMDVNAPELIAKAAGLHSTMDKKTSTQSISFSTTGQVQDASISYSQAHSTAINHVNAALSAGGHMSLHNGDGAMKLVNLDGANIVAQTMDADIDRLVITDKQDQMTNHVASASASASGQISAYKGDGSASTTAQQSGIHVTEGINTNGHSVHVGEAIMNGGKITSDGLNLIQIDRLEATALQDEQHYSGVGFSMNVHDLERLSGQKATNAVGEQAIAFAEVSLDHVNHQEVITSVIYGAQGTAPDIKELIGTVHTSSADGRSIIRDEESHVKLDVPVTNGDYMAQSRENITAGLNTIGEALGLHKPGDQGNEDDLEPKVLPSRRDEEEEEEEEESERPEELGDDEMTAHQRDERGTSEESAESDNAVFDPATGLTFDSPEAKAEFDKSVDVYQKAIKSGKPVPDETKIKLEENIKSAFIETFKAGTEERWARLTAMLGADYNQKLTQILSQPDAASKLGVKSFMSAKGGLFTFTFNLGLASLDSSVDKNDVLKEGAINSVADISFGAVLKWGTGSLSGPIGWSFVGLGILDRFTYSEEAVEALVNRGLGFLNEAQRLREEGHYWASLGMAQAASHQIRAAGGQEAVHQLVSLPSRFAHYLWDKVAPNASVVDRNTLFSPERRQAQGSDSLPDAAEQRAPSL